MRKIHAVRKVIQCTHCRVKCEKCGIHVDATEYESAGTDTQLRVPYRFCFSCSEEYIDYIDRLKGEGDPDCYWHNEAWMNSWQAWISYKSALDQHTRSKEFLRLLRELKGNDT